MNDQKIWVQREERKKKIAAAQSEANSVQMGKSLNYHRRRVIKPEGQLMKS